ncbi:MAG: hypothetical protein IJV82_04570 [Oscillospiraceae bacterium]|nr:hypothetical protein [Oscillospiraceae bacterium]
MSTGQICYEPSATPDISSVPGEIKKVEQDETVTIKRPTNHNEISLMENDWALIKDKANSIALKRKFDLSTVIAGAIIPYTIDIIADFINKTDPNYFPLAICIVLLVLVKVFARKLPWIGDDNMIENRVHLNDLKRKISQVDAVVYENEKKKG